ncbi:MAG: hypothetical protein H8E20_15425 [Verrucomicrobia bacterium]|nr:hypothetical protein [Verrucomicrobiota bacterium]
MSHKELHSREDIPDALQQQFAVVRRRLWRVETAMALCLAAAGLFGSYLVLFFSDRLWDSPGWLRLGLLAAGIGITLGSVGWWLARWVFHRRDTRALAKLVQRRYRRLGDRLLGIVELADEAKRPAIFSPSLYRAAIGQVAGEALKLDFRQTVNPRPARRRAVLAAGLIAVAVIAWAVIPQAGWNTLQRWGLPVADISRHTLVRLTGFPGEMVVAKGESFGVNGAVEYRSFWRPGTGSARYNDSKPISTDVTDANVRFTIPGQIEDGALTVKVGDARHAVAVRPVQRPAMRELHARIELPAYLQYPVQTETVQAAYLPVLRGSTVSFQGRVSRDLNDAQVAIDDEVPQTMSVRNEHFSSPAHEVGDTSHFAFTWRDEHDLAGAAAWQLNVEATDDDAPRPDLGTLGRDLAILETEVLELNATVRDDFGVKAAGVEWRALGQAEEAPVQTAGTLTALANGTQESEFEAGFHFSPAVLGIGKDTTVELAVWATDHLPGREPSRTMPYRLHILGTEDHAEMVRQKLEDILENLEEVSRTEEDIAEETRELAKADDDTLAKRKTNEKIEQTADEQRDNAEALKDLAEEGAKALMEAMRNPAFDEQTLRDWAQNLQQMNELADQQMKQAESKLGQAQQSSEPQEKKENLADALEEEEEALDELADLQDKVNSDLDNLQALTLAQRLRKISKEEMALRKKIKDIIQETIGLTPDDLPERHARANTRFTKSQGRTHAKAVELQGEISRFYERTGKGQYGEVSREMETEKTGEALEEIEQQIGANISMLAIRNLGNWSGQFEEWAKKLEPPKEESEGGGQGSGQGGEQKMNDLMKLLFSMLRLRESELRHRQQTGLLEQQKGDAGMYAKGVERLTQMHADSMLELNRMQFETTEPAMLDPLQETFDSMEITDNLLDKPQTDAVTVEAQTGTIRAMSDVINLINEEVKRDSGQQGQSQAQQEMAFMMAMMAMKEQMGQGMQQSQNAGGSQAGGTTQQAASALTGDAVGREEAGRSVSRGSGAAARLPEEFRAALQDYFKAVETFEGERK